CCPRDGPYPRDHCASAGNHCERGSGPGDARRSHRAGTAAAEATPAGTGRRRAAGRTRADGGHRMTTKKPLFRQEVIDSRRGSWLGGVSLSQPLSLWIWTSLVVVTVIAIALFVT